MTCNERFDLSDFSWGFGSVENFLQHIHNMNGGLQTRTINWAGLHGIWSKERESWHRDLGELIMCLISIFGDDGEKAVYLSFITTAFFFLFMREKPPS